MTFVLWTVLVLVSACSGLVIGAALGANARSELEDEIRDLQRRLFSRYEEHA